MCAKLLSLAALISAAWSATACSQAEQQSNPVIRLKITAGDKVIANERHEFTFKQMSEKMKQAIDRYKARGIAADDCTVEISGDASATCGELEELIKISQEQGITKFSLRFDCAYEFELPLAVPHGGLPEDPEVAPVQLRLESKEDGSLAKMRLNDAVLPSTRELRQQMIAWIGDKRGPGSIADQLEVEIRADQQLKLVHLGDIYAALSGYQDADGKFVSLVQHIYPVRRFDRPEIVEEIIEFETIELEPLDVETVEFAPPVEIDEVLVAPTPDSADKPVEGAPTLDTSSRDPMLRKQLVKKYGGNEASEKAVAEGLKWIASRQASDGGWNFDHNDKLIAAKACPNPGEAVKARNGATGMALLPFLAAGHTHANGDYKKEVHAGLAYLIKNMKVDEKTGSWNEPQGTMYAHGFAAIAVCEAYAMTGDKELLTPAQYALNYIVFSQDPVGGGWRYQPKQAGDSSVTALQTYALKKGLASQLEIPKKTVLGTSKFFDSVQSNDGGQYGYTAPAEGRAGTTAMGLLSRMYLGWKKDEPDLKEGIEYLDKLGPSKSDIYYNYHATMVMFQYGDEPWQRWNARIRDKLIEAQETDEGPAAGSWYFGGSTGSARGGRLFCTSLATLILETYYREPPIYGDKDEAEDEFPLE